MQGSRRRLSELSPQRRDGSQGGRAAARCIHTRKRVLDPMTAYQITAMMQGVVTEGTASRRVKLGRPVAGKTGTTNDNRDAWFVGFTPDLVTGVYIGYDEPASMGRAGTGSALAAPVFNEFMIAAMANVPISNFLIPSGMTEHVISRRTGMTVTSDDPDAIIEAFKPGSAPAKIFQTIEDGSVQTKGAPEVERLINSGAVGLF